MKRYLLLFMLSMASFGLSAQVSDSLRKLLSTNLPDTARAVILADLSMQLGATNIDSSLVLAEQAQALADKTGYGRAKMMAKNALGNYYLKKSDFPKAQVMLEETRALAQEIGDLRNVGIAYHSIGVIFHYQGMYDKALENYLKAAETRQGLGDRVGLALTYNNIAIIYKQQGNYAKALEYFFGIQKTLEELGKTNAENYGNVFNGIGSIYHIQKDYAKALSFYERALQIYEANGFKQKIALACNNIGSVYKEQGDLERSKALQLKNLAISEEIGSKINITFACRDLADTYLAEKNAAAALPYLQKGLEAAIAINSKERIAALKAVYAQYYNVEGKYAEAFRYAWEAEQIAAEIKSLEISRDALMYKYTAAKQLGKQAEALASYERFIVLRDSMVNEQNLKNAFAMEYAHKEEQLKFEQEKQALAHEVELEQQKFIRNSLIGGCLSLVLLAFMAFRSYQIKKKDNDTLAKQRKEIAEKNDELNQVNEELHQQQEELLMLNENLEVQKQKVETTYTQLKTTSDMLNKSIQYASHIQEVILPEIAEMQAFFSEIMVIFRPKDVVSGDFYWFSQIDGQTAVLALADCTGHGVPGGFMSMLGSTLLHETVNIKGVIDDPARVLRNLHAGFRNLLRQEQGKNDDGMDISICVFKKTDAGCTLTFAGAKSRICYIENGEAKLLAGDNIYIGGKGSKKEFVNKHVQLAPQSPCFLFSDGWADQHGEDGEKFGRPRLLQLLKEGQQKPLGQLEQDLLHELAAHQGSMPQRDDISLIGLRF